MTSASHLGVAIVGTAQTKYEPAKRHLAINELVYEVVRELLDTTGVKMTQIHSQITASQDMFDGKTISGMSVNEVVGGYLKSECKVAADGLQALFYGTARVASGSFDYTLVVAHCKESEGNPHPITGSMFDPFTERQLGLDALLASAMQAQRYEDVTGISADDLAAISKRRHAQATRNPFSQRSGDYSVEQITKSSVLAGVIRELLAGPYVGWRMRIAFGQRRAGETIRRQSCLDRRLGKFNRRVLDRSRAVGFGGIERRSG